jgi:hypothetical protein
VNGGSETNPRVGCDRNWTKDYWRLRLTLPSRTSALPYISLCGGHLAANCLRPKPLCSLWSARGLFSDLQERARTQELHRNLSPRQLGSEVTPHGVVRQSDWAERLGGADDRHAMLNNRPDKLASPELNTLNRTFVFSSDSRRSICR